MDDEKDQKEQSSSLGKRSLLYRIWSKVTDGVDRRVESEDDFPENEIEEIKEVEPPPPPPPPKVEVSADTVLYQLWVQWRGATKKDFDRPITLWDDLKEPSNHSIPFPGDKAAFLIELNRTAEGILKRKDEHRVAVENAMLKEKNPPEPMAPVDATIKIRIAKDLMNVWMFIFPPQGGKDMSVELLQFELNRAGITYGINQAKLEQAVAEQQYYRVLLVATGTLPVDGIDGWIEDCVSRTDEVDIKEKEDGSVNYKDMNLLRCVTKDTVLCRVIKPIESTKGCNVKGRPIPGYSGKNPTVPKGENTLLSADGTELLAAIDGHVSFSGDRFRVKKQLVISGDVDNSVGNLDFIGDIMVFGDVREGFSIKARGDICVDGSVEGASLFAGGSIRIKKGMNGNGKGLLNAQENITCKYLENCTASAKGIISVGSIVCCNISCNDTVQVLSDKGAIIGGTLTVLRLVEAKAIGSKSNRVTEIFLGYTPDMLTEKNQLESQLQEAHATLLEMNKDISYLERFSTSSAQDQERQDKLGGLKLKRSLQMLQQDKLSKKLNLLIAEIDDLSSCRVKSTVIYPFTKITIGAVSCTVQKTENHCNVFYASDRVMIGSQ